jgi:hypothetical protein
LADWEATASTMAAIYENASFTIAASCAQSSTEGLRPLVHKNFTATRITPESAYYVRMEAIEFTRILPVSKSLWPLLSRAWAFQERRLSRRILYFSAYQVVFECRTCRRSEDGRSNSRKGEDYDSERFDILPADVNPSSLVTRWHKIVSAYTQLEMTYESDKLAALAALAGRMSSFRNADVYFAGMWHGTLLFDLHWHGHYIRSTRSFTWKPTWSWVSTQGTIHYETVTSESHLCVELLDLTYEYIGDKRIGRVKEAHMTIRGPVLQLARRRGSGFYGTYNVYHHKETTTANERFQTESHPDFWEGEITDEPSEEEFLTILLGHDPEKGYGGPALQRINANTFQRVGHFYIRPMARTEKWSYQLFEHDGDLYLQLIEYVESLPQKQVTIT